MPRATVGKKTIHHIDFEALADVNSQVVKLTGESHEYSKADAEKLREVVEEVEQRADNQEHGEAVLEKAALLVFKLASGQYFHAGNKRTALVAGLAFLTKNGFTFKIDDADFVSAVDRAGIAAASLDEVYEALQKVAKKRAVDRKGWDKVVAQLVVDNRNSITELGS